MFDQCMGDGYNGNHYMWGQTGYGQYGQWAYDSYNGTPWYNQCPYNNWNWYTGYNNYEQSYAPCHHYYAEHPNMPLLNDPNSEYKMYQRRLTGHYMKQEAGSSMNEPPLWKSVKIDCFSAKMNMHKTQSELLKKALRSLNKASRRKHRKRRYSGTSRSSTNMRNSNSKLGRKVYLNGGGLAYILFKPKETECDERNRGDSPNVPFTYYPSKKRHDMEQEFYDRQQYECENDETPAMKSNEYINNLNKLYADINGGLGSKTKSMSHCTPEELAEIRHEFEVFFNTTTRSSSKQTQTKLKMKTIKSVLNRGRRELASVSKQKTETKKRTLRKDSGLKGKKTRLPRVARLSTSGQAAQEIPTGKAELPSNSNNNKRNSRNVTYHPGRAPDERPKIKMRSTYAPFLYTTAWGRK